MKVKIKTWEEMEKEFGLDDDGDVVCCEFFTTEMEAVMPMDRIIEVKRMTDEDTYWFEEGDNSYIITMDMIEEVIAE